MEKLARKSNLLIHNTKTNTTTFTTISIIADTTTTITTTHFSTHIQKVHAENIYAVKPLQLFTASE